MKQFELTLVRRDRDKIANFEKIEGETLVEILSKLLLVIVTIQQTIHEEQKAMRGDDDIPF